MPAPCVIDGRALDALAAQVARQVAGKVAHLVDARSRPACPSPATTTRGAGSLPSVWISVNSPDLPRMSPGRSAR